MYVRKLRATERPWHGPWNLEPGVNANNRCGLEPNWSVSYDLLALTTDGSGTIIGQTDRPE